MNAITYECSQQADLVTLARDFFDAKLAPATQAAYAKEWAAFEAFCGTLGVPNLPASPQTVTLYVTALAHRGIRPASISKAVAAIGNRHGQARLEDPTGDAVVRDVMAGIRRKLGTRQRQAAPLTVEHVEAMQNFFGDDPQGLRDRALILLGFACALRRSEVVGIDVEHLRADSNGAYLLIPRSKTDQEGAGQEVAIPNGAFLRPLEAVREWQHAGGVASGPLFRSTAGATAGERLSDQSVNLIVKKYAKAIGLDPRLYSGHSLRAGFVTSALESGASVRKVMEVTRHQKIDTVGTYDRHINLFRDHAGTAFL